MPGRYAVQSHGLGDSSSPQYFTTGQTCFGQPLNLSPSEISLCSGGGYWFLPECWCLSQEDWQAAAKLPTIPTSLVEAPGAPATALTDPNAVLDDTTGATSQALSNAALDQTASNVQSWVSSLPDNPLGTAPCAWMNVSCTWWAIIGIGAAALFLIKGGLK